MIATEGVKYRSNRAASIHCISGPLLTRKTSQDLSSWRSEYYFHGKEIGRGHFSKVYHVTCLTDNNEGAVKVIRRRRGGIDRIQTIRQEIKIMQDLMKNNIQSVIKLNFVHESYIEVALVMEIAKGGCLFDVVRESQNGLPENYVQQIIKRLLSALLAMHKTNIVHLDIKADNILLREPYPSTDIALCDFGLATQLSSGKVHRELVGTPDYIAPEIINYEEISMFTDMWSLGVLTYYLLTSESPFMADTKEMTMLNVSKINYNFPEEKFTESLDEAKDFISKLIVKKPNMRLSATEADRHKWLSSIVLTVSSDSESSNQKSDLEILEESKSLSSDSGYESCL